MAIESPPRGVDALDERLASLEDPAFAAHLVDENPSLYIRALAQRDREARARTRWTAALAGTAIVSMTAGLFLSPMVMKFFMPAQATRHTVATAPPRSSAPRRHVQPKHRALVIPPRPVIVDAQAEIRHMQARAAAVKPAFKPALKPQIQPAAVDQAASTQASTGAATAAAPAIASTTSTSPAYYPDPPPPTWSKSGPPSGTGTQHWGTAGPVILVGRDPCTPPGGRIGNVLQHF